MRQSSFPLKNRFRLSKQTRPPHCDDCHNNPQALGMGSGVPETFKTGRKLIADPDRFVDENGNQLLAFTQLAKGR